jgi:DNA-directed RNA polymerase subunit M/transcription elongation factor TFIIS
MEFCPDCNNYLFLKINNNENNVGFTYNCRNCGYTDIRNNNNVKSVKQQSIYNNPENIDKVRYYASKKELIRYDPTMPHIDNIPCPNKECISHKEPDKNDIIYLTIDKIKLQMLYICNNCVTHWTNKSE